MNFKEKIKTTRQHRKNRLKIPTRRRKIWSRNWKSKSRRRRNVVEKSQSESKTFDVIDVGH